MSSHELVSQVTHSNHESYQVGGHVGSQFPDSHSWVAITAGLLTYSTRSLTTRATRIHLVSTPYYPVPIAVGFVVGYFTYTRFKGLYSYWAWLGPAILVLVSLLAWKSANQVSWLEATAHFFGRYHIQRTTISATHQWFCTWRLPTRLGHSSKSSYKNGSELMRPRIRRRVNDGDKALK
jgi:hypothetical protein